MGKLKYLNVGCGSRYHKDWINIDMSSNSENVIETNLLKGIPFPDNYFDVVYHSQVLEHFPKEKAPVFLEECCRVLKPNGIIRIVVPDLENLVDEYKKFLNVNLEQPSPESEANYDWILLEMYDQTVRNYSGGMMAETLSQSHMINEKYISDRIGFIAKDIKSNNLKDSVKGLETKSFSFLRLLKKKTLKLYKEIIKFQFSENSKIGAFRLGGEIHMWMYDRFSLSRLLEKSGFEAIIIQNPRNSIIPDWENYELDIRDGIVDSPTSLFVEARKK